MIEIIPAILPKSFADLEQKMSLVAGLVPMVQIDITDGHFVPSKTWPHTSGAVGGNGQYADRDFAAILSERGDFPFVEELDFEVDLMVANPENVWRDWIHAGAKRIIIHAESVKGFGSAEHAVNILELLRAIQKEIPSRASLLHVEIGVAINPDTPNEILASLMDEIDFVQFMGIERIGFQGEKFDERVLSKISDLRTQFPNVTISVDGGVTSETAPKLVAAGANRLAVGSAIFGGAGEDSSSEEIPVALDQFSESIENN